MRLSYFFAGRDLAGDERDSQQSRSYMGICTILVASSSCKIKNRPDCARAVLCGRDKNLETELQIQFCTGARRRKTDIGVVIFICQILYR
jgi:hypothetical protein